MKNIVENNVKQIIKKYKYNTLLTLIIFILFFILGYSNTNMDYTVYVDNKQAQMIYGICTKNNEQYIHIDDLTSIFNDNIYNDKISGKLIITTYDKIKKIENNDSDYVTIKNSNKYYNLKKIISEIEYDMIVSEEKIYIFDTTHVYGIVNNNRTELYDIIDGNIITHLQKDSEVKVYIDENINDESKKIVNIEVSVNNKTYYGYVLKNNIEYKYESLDVENVAEKIILVKADNKLMTTTDTNNIDMVAINMYRLSGVNTLTKLEYTNNVPNKIHVLATINNGQKSSNYDSDIVTRMLNSETNRYEVIQQILKSVKNLAGVNLDFSNFKVTDKEEYTQFIKELASVLHSDNKILVVNVPNNQYIDVEKIIKVADYIILQPYTARTLSSKTSGPISAIYYVEQSVQNVINKSVDVNKVILEMPAYTILWTERKGTVINAEQYNMKTMADYLNANDIHSKLDNVSSQNYIHYTKGITTYKMWLEDEYSLTQKTELVNKYNLAGVSIYRSGMEQKEIYDKIYKILNK